MFVGDNVLLQTTIPKKPDKEIEEIGLNCLLLRKRPLPT